MKTIRTIMWFNVVALIILTIINLDDFNSQHEAKKAYNSSKLFQTEVGKVAEGKYILDREESFLKEVFKEEAPFKLTSYTQQDCVDVLDSFAIEKEGDTFFLVGTGFDKVNGLLLKAKLVLKIKNSDLFLDKNANPIIDSELVLSACNM